MPDFEAEPDAVFSQEEWTEIARSIPLADLPREMKEAISQVLFDHALMSTRHSEAESRRALGKLVKMTQSFRRDLIELQGDLRPESIIDQVEDLIEQTRALQKTANREWQRRRKSKGGRPRLFDRDELVERLTRIYTQFSGKEIGLSRSRTKQNQDRSVPGGPCYRFVCKILKLKGLPTKGVEHVIAKAARHAKNHSIKK